MEREEGPDSIIKRMKKAEGTIKKYDDDLGGGGG